MMERLACAEQLAVLATIVDCARTDALAELLCRHATSGSLAGVREVLAEGADVNRGIYKGSASEGDLTEITPLQHACIQGETRRACLRLSRRVLISIRSSWTVPPSMPRPIAATRRASAC